MSWLSLFLLLIMLAIMFFQVIHGMFSAMIMAVACVLSATVALGAHEQLAESMLTNMIGDYAYPVSFVGIFGLSVLGLRMLLDMIVARNILLPGIVDKAGAAAFGIITGLITVGVMGIGIQMIPFGPTIVGFQRFDEKGEPHDTLWPSFCSPDAFTLLLCGHLSDSTLSGDATHWTEIHPDFLTELHWLRNTTSEGSRISVDPNSVKVVGDLKRTERLFKFKRATRRRGSDTFEGIDGPPSGKLWLIVGVEVNGDGADSDGRFRYSPTQVRLVGETAGGTTEQYALKAVGPFEDRHLIADAGSLWGNSTGIFDFVFEVPAEFTPRFVAFKRAGRAKTPSLPTEGLGGLALKTTTATSSLPVSTASADEEPPRNQRRGSTTPVRPQKQGSHFSNKMPMEIRRYAGTMVESSGSELSRGQLALLVDEQEEQQPGQRGRRNRNQDPERTTLDSFDVPSGLHLLQLNVEALHASTMLGGSLNLARRVLQQYRVIDTNGRDYWPVGLIAECDSDGEREMEIQYFPEESEFQRALRSFRRIKYGELIGDYRFVLLFFIPEGVEIEQFDSGRKAVDISELKLIAGG